MNDVPQPLTAEQKRRLLAELLRKRSEDAQSAAAADEADTGSLSYGQRALWFVYQLDPQSAAYNILYASYVPEDVDRPALDRAFQRLVDRHAALRTTFGTEDGLPVARVASRQEFVVETTDASAWTELQLEQQIHAEADRPFDLQQGPVIRARLYERAGGPHVLLITAAHIAVDFWSLDLLLAELQSLYEAEASDKPAATGATGSRSAGSNAGGSQYADFVRWQEETLAGPEGERLWSYWREALAGPLPALALPTDRPRPPVQTYRGETLRFDLPRDLSRRLAALAKAEGATLNMVVLAAFEVLLYRWSGQREVLVGASTAGRSSARWEETVGYFLNMLVLRGRIEADMTFAEFLAQVRETVLGGLSHQEFPFPLLVERLSPPRDASRSPLFQVAFNWDRPRKLYDAMHPTGDEEHRGSHYSGAAPSLDLRPFLLGQRGAAFDLTLVMLHVGDSLSGAIQYNSDLFDRSTMQRFAGQLEMLLDAITVNPRQMVAELPLLSRSERQTLLEDWNDTAADYPRDLCLHELIAAQAARTPQRVAAVHDGRDMTYGELDERSNRLARCLVQLGVGPEVLVGVYMERSREMLVGLLGVLKAGGAYVPLAPGTPAERLQYMLEESRAPVVVTQSNLASTLPDYKGRVLLLDDDWPSITQEIGEPLPQRAEPHNLAYVIFTSGSTGRPKGVQIEHRSVVNFLSLVERRPGIAPDDRLLAVTTLSFDISVLELFLPLCVGARVVIADRETAADGRLLVRAIAESGATLMQATPATWRLLLQAGWQGDANLKVLCGGEALPRDLADLLLPRCGNLWNMYGPTETTIWSAVDRVLPGTGPVPIGPPIANTQFYVLDERMQPVPVGIPGELYIGGDGVARGYLNRPELTAERFPADPFRADSSCDGRQPRMFKTGDVVRYRPDGRIEFLGRADFQVKVRGFRIELGEIEAALARHPCVRENVVVARQASAREDDKQLVAYLVSINGAIPAGELRRFLKQTLPDYMLPTSFVTLDALPLNASGKVDRRALPEADKLPPELATEYVAPRTALEDALVEIWASVLGRDRVGVDDDYFELGGASMQSMEIAARAAESGIELAPALLFQHPSVARLAAAIADRSPADADRHTSSVEEAAEGSVSVAEVVRLRESTEECNRSLTTSATAQAAAAAEPAKDAPVAAGNTVVESLGVYLPPKEVTTDEVVRGCRNRVWFPLERMCGIHARRMSEEGDYCVDLARKAVEECLALSKYGPDDIDLLICCNITRGKTPVEIWFEPCISLQLKRIFGFEQAVAFDVTNACGGMFTAIAVANAWLGIGAARRALVVSGEFITGITRTAQKEISSFLDPRIACLTVGDAGAAVLLETGGGRETGFHQLEMYTVSRYNRMCIGRLTEHPHGGAIMHVPDPIKHTTVSAEQSVMHARHMFQTSPWPVERMQHLVIHQTSRRSLRDGMRLINKAFGRKVSHEGNTLDNLSHRGNTGSTTHFVALWDHILAGRVNSGDNVVFAVSGSGQTIGTAFYTLDDLPDRLRDYTQRGVQPAKQSSTNGSPGSRHRRPAPQLPRVSVRAIGSHVLGEGERQNTTRITAAAAEQCLARWQGDRNDVGLLLFAGMTRTDFIAEPAIASFIAGELAINDLLKSASDRKTLAFDVYNGALGMLNACEVAARMIQAGKCRTALVTTSEIEMNAEPFPDRLLGLLDAGSAMILEASPDGRAGFGQFVYRYATEHQSSRVLTGHYHEGRPLCDLQLDPHIERHYLEPVRGAVEELLAREGLTSDHIACVLPSQFSASFSAALAERLAIPGERVIDLTTTGKDLFTNSLPFSLEHALETGRARPGDVGLIVNVASGLQVGCTAYYF